MASSTGGLTEGIRCALLSLVCMSSGLHGPPGVVGQEWALTLERSGFLHFQQACLPDWGTHLPGEPWTGLNGWAEGTVRTCSELFAMHRNFWVLFSSIVLLFISLPSRLVNDITHFALRRPGKAGWLPHWGLNLEGQIDLWANCFIKHLKNMPVSGLFNLKFIKGLCAGGSQGPSTLFLRPWKQSWSLSP